MKYMKKNMIGGDDDSEFMDFIRDEVNIVSQDGVNIMHIYNINKNLFEKMFEYIKNDSNLETPNYKIISEYYAVFMLKVFEIKFYYRCDIFYDLEYDEEYDEEYCELLYYLNNFEFLINLEKHNLIMERIFVNDGLLYRGEDGEDRLYRLYMLYEKIKEMNNKYKHNIIFFNDIVEKFFYKNINEIFFKCNVFKVLNNEFIASSNIDDIKDIYIPHFKKVLKIPQRVLDPTNVKDFLQEDLQILALEKYIERCKKYEGQIHNEITSYPKMKLKDLVSFLSSKSEEIQKVSQEQEKLIEERKIYLGNIGYYYKNACETYNNNNIKNLHYYIKHFYIYHTIKKYTEVRDSFQIVIPINSDIKVWYDYYKIKLEFLMSNFSVKWELGLGLGFTRVPDKKFNLLKNFSYGDNKYLIYKICQNDEFIKYHCNLVFENNSKVTPHITYRDENIEYHYYLEKGFERKILPTSVVAVAVAYADDINIKINMLKLYLSFLIYIEENSCNIWYDENLSLKKEEIQSCNRHKKIRSPDAALLSRTSRRRVE